MNKSFLAILLASSFTGLIQAETVDIPVPKAAVVAAFNTALGGTKLHLDNYGSKQGTSWLSQSSYIILPDGSKKKFNISEQTTKVTNRRFWRHYINDFNTKNINVIANGNKLEMTAYFESQGEEIKGKCIKAKLISNKKVECKLKMERDIHLNNSQIMISLKPIAYNGSISFSNASATFKTDLKIPNKICQVFNGLCGKIENFIKFKIRSSVENTVKNELNKPGIKKAVANKVKSLLKNKIDPKWKVIKISSNSNKYIVRVQRPDTIDKNTVSISSFKALKKNANIKCPGNIDFNATIKTKTKVSGKFWLEFENGKKSNTHNWNMSGKGSQTSKVSRSWNAKNFKANSGWTRMALTWKDKKGKKYSKKSSKATFKRTCKKASGGKKLNPKSSTAPTMGIGLQK